MTIQKKAHNIVQCRNCHIVLGYNFPLMYDDDREAFRALDHILCGTCIGFEEGFGD